MVIFCFDAVLVSVTHEKIPLLVAFITEKEAKDKDD
jgi:hypothetical protein